MYATHPNLPQHPKRLALDGVCNALHPGRRVLHERGHRRCNLLALLDRERGGSLLRVLSKPFQEGAALWNRVFEAGKGLDEILELHLLRGELAVVPRAED